MRTYVRAIRGDDPARRPRRVLRVGRAARRPAPARPAGDRRRRASCSRRATRRRRTASARRWAARQARRLCPQAVVVPPRMSAYSEASKAVFEVFDDTTPLVEGLSIDEAFLDVRGLRADLRHAASRSPRGCGATCASGSACRSRSASRARSSSPRSRAASPSPTACSSCRPSGELAFLHPLPVERLWGVGPVTAGEAARRAGSRPSARSRGSPRRRSSRCSAARPAGTCTRSRTTATRGRCRRGRRRRSIGSQRALGRGADVAPTSSTPILVALVDRVTRRMRAARPRRPHGRAAAALRRLLAGDALAHAAAARPRRPQTILATRARAARGRRAADRARRA